MKKRKQRKQAYVVYKGRVLGIFETWEECKAQVHEYPGAVFKGYRTFEEALHKWEAFEAMNDQKLALRRWNDQK